MKILRTPVMTCVVLLAGLGIVSAQDATRSANQPTSSQDASSAIIQTITPAKQIHVMRLRSGPSSTGQLSAPFRQRARTSHTVNPLTSGTLTYTCDPNVAAATCTYLNTTVAGYYSSTFTNASANIYIKYGTTGLGQSEGYFNLVTYSQYLAALTANTNQSAVQVAALSALNTYDATPYGSDNVNVTAALGTALGFSGMTGITPGGGACTLGASGCYNEIITITNDPSITLYYDNLGGSEPSDAYDFYGVVAHETDEVLGTSSCIDTQDGGVLTDPCDFAGGSGTPSAVDLFRYNSAGELALNSSYLGLASAPAGAYFSYNGGTTNGVNGVANTPKVYNTLANGDDYADFVSSSPDCGTDIAVQDAEGCPGEDAGLSILNDGGGEIHILNAVGYSVPGAAPNFSLSASPNAISVAQGSSGGSTITITPSNGFDGSVTLSALNLPEGVTALFTPNPATTSSSLTLSASATAATGRVSVTIQGTSGNLTNTTPLSLNVTSTSSSQVTFSPASLTFGDLYVGNSEAFLVTLTNTGSTKVPIGPISFSATTGDVSQFSYHEFCQASLPAGRVCSVKVTFAPDAAGSDAATLNIVAGTSTIQVPITASGKNRKH